MISLFENYKTEEIDLEYSLKNSGYTFQTVVLQDNGYLPEHVDTPLKFFTQHEHPSTDAMPLFFNELDLPAHWEVHGSNRDAEIFEGYKQRGKIHYSNRKGDLRSIQSVEWWNDKEKQRAVDLYNQYGQRFGHKTYSDGDLSLTTYFDLTGREVIVQNHITGTIQVYYKGQTYIFNNYQSFILFYFDVAEIDTKNIFYNSLSIPYFITLALRDKNPDIAYEHTLFWQETSSTIPGNMVGILKESDGKGTHHIIVQDKQEYERLIKQVNFETSVSLKYLGWIYSYINRKTFSPSIFILTNSDQVEYLNELSKALPEYQFAVAARTEMSSKLMNFNDRANITLYPTISSEEIEKLLATSSIYLDINHGNEVENIVRQAYEYQQIILSFQQTTHNNRFITPSHIWNIEEAEKMIDKLKEINQGQDSFEKALMLQKIHAGHENSETYREVIDYA